MSKPHPDKTLALALVIRRAALMLAKLIEDYVRIHYGYSVGAPTRDDGEGLKSP